MNTQNTQHTPGHWKLSAILNPLSDSAPPIGFRVEHSDGGIRSVVAECRDYALCDEHGTIDANARLIAASPDLLAALEWSMRCIGDYLSADSQEARDYCYKDLAHAHKQAIQAIAKAKGEV